jgi:hypothetical protein
MKVGDIVYHKKWGKGTITVSFTQYNNAWVQFDIRHILVPLRTLQLIKSKT